MAIIQAVCNVLLSDLLKGQRNFDSGGDTFKIALYTSSATLSATSTQYTTTNEVSGTGYSAGGNTLTNNGVVGGSGNSTAYCDFADSTWAASTITARGAMIYESTTDNPACLILDFGADKSSSAGDFTIIFPAADASNAILRIS